MVKQPAPAAPVVVAVTAVMVPGVERVAGEALAVGVVVTMAVPVAVVIVIVAMPVGFVMMHRVLASFISRARMASARTT